jgi:hypothetical protein
LFENFELLIKPPEHHLASQGMVQHLQQLDQCQRRFGLAVLVQGEGVYAAAENFASFALSKLKLLAHGNDKSGITMSCPKIAGAYLCNAE